MIHKRISVLDFETSYQKDEKGRTDPSAYNSKNFLVSYGVLHNDILTYKCLKHNAKDSDPDAFEFLQNVLDNTDILIAHNCKFELQWLKACGFKYEGHIADPMIMSYVLSRGQKLPLSLKECCKRYGVSEKKTELIDEYMKKSVQFSDIPWEVVKEYGEQDVISCYELWGALIKELESCPYLWPTIDLMHEFCVCLTDIEENGIAIDVAELDRLEKEYKLELNSLKADIQKIIYEVMGDTPINIDSPQQLSELIYSRRVTDKAQWKLIFNLGSEIRGSVIKPKYRPKMKLEDFVRYVKTFTTPIYKTKAEHCLVCDGKGTIQKTRVDGITPFVRRSLCSSCNGAGYVLSNVIINGKPIVAGLRCVPNGPQDTAVGGFGTDKGMLEALAYKATGIAKEFIEKSKRINAISNYIDTVIAGIRRGIRDGNILHTSFMQCITATGRLSSQNPNFQNIPRGYTFPIKKAIVSRFKNGHILEADFSQLEFRVAGILSGNKQIALDIANKVDVHSDTAKFTGLSRQDFKPYTFKPLYGGRPEGNPENIAKYIKHFIKKYDLDSWGWEEEVLANGGYYRLPSGREFYFPNTKRFFNGSISNSTIIKNYRVQSFATADIVPIAVISIWKLFKYHNLKSCIIITVHDSVEVDVHPDELDIVKGLVDEGMASVKEECIKRYNFELTIPLDWEIKSGPNWLEQKEIK